MGILGSISQMVKLVTLSKAKLLMNSGGNVFTWVLGTFQVSAWLIGKMWADNGDPDASRPNASVKSIVSQSHAGIKDSVTFTPLILNSEFLLMSLVVVGRDWEAE